MTIKCTISIWSITWSFILQLMTIVGHINLNEEFDNFGTNLLLIGTSIEEDISVAGEYTVEQTPCRQTFNLNSL